MKMRYCLECTKELKGRSDKKFCDTQCRSTFHNTNKAPHELDIQNINSLLRSNRSLMAHFCPSGKSTVDKEVLTKLGFKFDLFTHIFPFSTGTYFFCYDYGYLPISDKGLEKVVIVQKQAYMQNLNFCPWGFNLIKNN
jgi:hypothetical protein